MSWHPSDLVSDVDLTDYEAGILTRMGVTTWQAKRTKALEDWLFPIIKGQGFDPYKLRTRYECDGVQGYTGAAYTDFASAAKDTTDDDVNLATIFTTFGSDALYLGSTAPFRGVFFRLLEAVNSVGSVLSVSYWNGNWESLTVSDSTAQVSGKTFSAGGSVTWVLPVDWATRKINSVGPYYWVKLTVSATPTGAKAGQIGAIRGSVFRAPVTFRTLSLIFREAPTGAPGPWEEKAIFYEREADAALQRALIIAGGDFDTDSSDEISPEEAAQTAAQVSNGWKIERA